jgi:GTP-binding protein
MKKIQVEFVGSFVDTKSCPAANLPEYAFIGRSNVGKSSLVNALTQRNDIAHVSSTPGKTQTINYFKINKQWFLVDLPGYGYAQVGKEKREQFASMIEEYFQKRENLLCVFVLVDIRLPQQQSDRDFMRKITLMGLPIAIVFTKADKLSASQAVKSLEAYKLKLLEDFEELPQIFVTSSQTSKGIGEILEFVEKVNLKF